MELSLIKILVSIVSALGTIAGYKLNHIKSQQTKAVLINQFEEALGNKNKYSICELFSVIYGINMGYKDILEIIERDDLNKVLFVLKKTPGMVKYAEGRLQYNTVYKSSRYRVIEHAYTKYSAYLSGALAILIVTLLMPFAKGTLVLISLGFAVLGFTVFLLQWRETQYNNMLKELIENEK